MLLLQTFDQGNSDVMIKRDNEKGEPHPRMLYTIDGTN
jgi:hypothetical protein